MVVPASLLLIFTFIVTLKHPLLYMKFSMEHDLSFSLKQVFKNLVIAVKVVKKVYEYLRAVCNADNPTGMN